ncbi:MAG: hypothetical protein K1W06_06135 [Lachnospiraceae bacterium]
MPSKRKSNKRAKMEKRRVRHNQNKKEGVNMTGNITETADKAAGNMTETVDSTIVVTAAEEPAVIVEEEKVDNKKTENTINIENTKETVHKLYIQYNDLEFSDELLFEAAVNAYCNESGMDKSSVNAVNLYVKPQEGRAYYVINNDAEKSGSIEL